MRISDWISDVCSSDLVRVIGSRFRPLPVGQYPCSGTQTEPDQDPPAPRRAGLFLFVAFAPTKPKFTDPVDLVIPEIARKRPWATSTRSTATNTPSCRSEEHTSELQSLMSTSYAFF